MSRFAAFVAATSLTATCTTGLPNARGATSEVPGASAPAASAPTKRTWYGGTILLTAYGGEALVIHGALSDSYVPMAAGAALYLFGGAFVHAAHGEGGAAIASPFIAATPLVLALIASSVVPRRDEDEVAGGILVLGLLVAPLVDAFVLGWQRPRERALGQGRMLLAPDVARDRLGLAWGGSF